MRFLEKSAQKTGCVYKKAFKKQDVFRKKRAKNRMHLEKSALKQNVFIKMCAKTECVYKNVR